MSTGDITERDDLFSPTDVSGGQLHEFEKKLRANYIFNSIFDRSFPICCVTVLPAANNQYWLTTWYFPEKRHSNAAIFRVFVVCLSFNKIGRK